MRVLSGVGWIGPGSTATIAPGTDGCRAPISTPIIPPRLWPTITGFVIPRLRQSPTTSSASVGMSYPSGGRSLSPQPRRSSVVTEHRLEEGAVAAPAVDEDELGAAAC